LSEFQEAILDEKRGGEISTAFLGCCLAKTCKHLFLQIGQFLLYCLNLELEFCQIRFQFGDLLGFRPVAALEVRPFAAAVTAAVTTTTA
jgi:hypothetical protein